MPNLTPQERQVILFLIIVALIGLGINLLSKHFSQAKIIRYINQDIGKINLNQADKQILATVPGIGKTLAQRIIERRNRERGFKNIDQLKNIKGIGKSRYEAIKDYFIIE
ncbi:MAG: helix-hairpin-helix domain-containing protein [Candidatus Omnitrophica bacterium]|nr:helix-hairpin-helix domain-containing protein [Candidatus Omnitrophota bacterium]